MAQSAAESRAKDDEDSCEDLHDAAFSSRGCCSFNFPCFRSRQSENWERISSSAEENEAIYNRSWWDRGADALKKVREWSELVAGPKWKTFIRRFNRTGGRARPAKFQYDPLSYSLNFDQGRGQNWECEVRDFSSRYAPIPAQNVQL
ncbi:hypothetical protein C2S52_002587 [Perilla frutescens var. hirtella]|nr:hypothetical protein C2S51_012857 [Perilla frutescens var. frutescens]KAH6791083.1 hypothetical protein C2S51_006089 [Perilla frutescens var. frutescens]KAH6792110.1 hypothetical protein C2S52_002587 [Perilla frutescens var. hirtella]